MAKKTTKDQAKTDQGKPSPKTKKPQTVCNTPEEAQQAFIDGRQNVLCYNHKNHIEYICTSWNDAKNFFSFSTVTKHNVYFSISYPTPEQEMAARETLLKDRFPKIEDVVDVPVDDEDKFNQ